MKNIFTSLLLITLGNFAHLAKALEPTEIPSPVEKILIPPGFDDNDNVEIVLMGKFLNPCYRVGKTSFEVDDKEKLIKISAFSYKYNQVSPNCTPIVTPFLQKLSLGVLPKGQYRVELTQNPALKSSLEVGQSTTEGDEFLYGPVSSAYVTIDKKTGRQKINLLGEYPRMLNGCMVIKEVRVSFGPKDVVVVRPIAKILANYECKKIKHRSLSFKVGKFLTTPFKGDGLLHVRVTNGNSINQYVSVPEMATSEGTPTNVEDDDFSVK